MSTSNFARNFAALPSEFRDAHPRPLFDLSHEKVSAWLNELHDAVATTCANYLHMAESARDRGDWAVTGDLLNEAAPYSRVLADLNGLVQKRH